MDMNDKQSRILELKKEKNAVIMAHYYVDDEIQEIADFVGDSYYLSEMATKIDEDVIVLCGVSFMGESAKLLNPNKTILLPDETADCPMAHMASIEKIEEVRKEYGNNVAVVCYVNSTAELKAHADVCVTSSNALKVVRALPNSVIYFIPDRHLGSYISKQLPEKKFIYNDGGCPIHLKLTSEKILECKEKHPEAKVLVHPECDASVVKLSDYAGSTSGIIDYASKSDALEFIIGTELGVMYELKKKNPEKNFYPATEELICLDMKKVTLDKIIDVLESDNEGIQMTSDFVERANLPLKRMLQLSR